MRVSESERVNERVGESVRKSEPNQIDVYNLVVVQYCLQASKQAVPKDFVFDTFPKKSKLATSWTHQQDQ